MKTKDSAVEDAADFVSEFIGQVIDQLIDDGQASDDLLNDYDGADSYHHETHVDKSYSLLEAAQILDDLSEHEETDEGLWQGLKPRGAISAQAAYTYGNAVYALAQNIISEINGDTEIETILDNISNVEILEDQELT